MPFSDPQNWGKEEGPEGENAHHRPKSRAQRDHSPEKEAGLPGWGDGLKTLQATGHQAPLSWQLTDPSTQTSTRGTTWEGTRYCPRATSQRKHNQRLPSHPLCPRQSVRCVQQRKKSRVGREKDVKRSNTQVSPLRRVLGAWLVTAGLSGRDQAPGETVPPLVRLFSCTCSSFNNRKEAGLCVGHRFYTHVKAHRTPEPHTQPGT